VVFHRLIRFLDARKSQKLQQYKMALERVVSDGVITPEEEAFLLSLREELGLREEDVKDVSVQIFREEFSKAISDEHLSLEERARLEQLRNALGLSDEDIRHELEKIMELTLLMEIQKGKLPEIPLEEASRYIVLTPGEICHCVVNAELYEKVMSKGRGYYHGLSFRIARGVYYRIGTYTMPKIKEEIKQVDEGILIVTSARIVFLGKQRDLEIPLGKLLNIELFQDAFSIHRKGRKKPEYFVVDRPKLIAGLIHVAATKALEKTTQRVRRKRYEEI